MKTSPFRTIEILESRIAPAALVATANATIDANGDLVTVEVGTPIVMDDASPAIILVTSPAGGNDLLDGAADGLTNPGRVTSAVELQAANLRGDLTASGAGERGTPGLKNVVGQSLLGVVASTGTILGPLSALKTDFVGPDLRARGTAPDSGDAAIGVVNIGGNLPATSSSITGYLETQGAIGPARGVDLAAGSPVLL